MCGISRLGQGIPAPVVGRVAVVTGASSGIGLETARALARRGMRLAITGRNPERLEAAREQIAAEGVEVRAFEVDFSSLDAVRRFTRELLIPGDTIHVLVHNAGVWHQHFTRSKDGLEDTFAVNHLAPFLITHRVLGRMIEAEGEARIVHVSSRLHSQAGGTQSLTGRLVHTANVVKIPLPAPPAELDFDAIDDPRGYRGLEAYARSKLAQVIFSNALARRLAGTGVTSNAVHPGSVRTNVVRDNATLAWLNDTWGKLVLKTPEQGAATSVHVATSPQLDGVTGRYFIDSKEARPASVANDRALAERLWAYSIEKTGLRIDETPPILR